MNPIADLVKRTQRLENHVQALRQELDGLRKDLESLQAGEGDLGKVAGLRGTDCLAVALAMAEDLGPDFPAEDPYQFFGYGGSRAQ